MHCNYFVEQNNGICGASAKTIRLLMIHPDHPTETIYLCAPHLQAVHSEVSSHYKSALQNYYSLTGRRNNQIRIAKSHGVPLQRQNDESVRVAEKTLFRTKEYECRIPYCRNSLRDMVYSAILTKNARFDHAYYFCSYKCWTHFRRMCDASENQANIPLERFME